MRLMGLIDRRYTDCPFYGSRRMTAWLNLDEGQGVNRKRVQRLMRRMGLEAVYPRPRLSAGPRHKVYPYLLRGVSIDRPDQVWSTDITYVGLPGGFMYLAAVIDWHSRFVLSWELSNTLDGSFCLDALEAALAVGRPEVFNTDQGVQFTAEAFTSRLESAGVKVSMDGKGRCLVRRVRGAAVAEREVRGRLPARVRERAAVAGRAVGLLRLLQRGKAAPGAGLPNARRGLPGGSGQGGLTAEAFFFPPHALSPR